MAELTFADLPDLLTLEQARAAVGMSDKAMRDEIKSGALPAFIPRGRDPMKAGRGQGYRIHKADLQAWYFGTKP